MPPGALELHLQRILFEDEKKTYRKCLIHSFTDFGCPLGDFGRLFASLLETSIESPILGIIQSHWP